MAEPTVPAAASEQIASATPPPPPRLAWPPPGLERLQGDIWPVVNRLTLGGLVLVLPLLWAVTSERGPWSPGPFGTDWWAPVVTTLVGGALLLAGVYALIRLLRRSAAALDRGYGWVTVALVSADATRDTGFALQGARAYSTLSPAARRHLLLARLMRAGAYLALAGWLPLGFAAAVVLAAAGALGPRGVVLVTLAPPALLLVCGLAARAIEGTLVRRAKKAWFRRPWSADLARQEVEDWKGMYTAFRGEGDLGPGAAGRSRVFRVAAGAGVVLLLAAFFPPVTIVGTASVSAVLATISLPKTIKMRERVAAAEPLRAYVLEPDPAVTPAAAGEALRALTTISQAAQPEESMREPARRYEVPWIPDDTPPELKLGFPDTVLALIGRGGRGLSPDLRKLLEAVAAHPAHAEMELLARAASLDLPGALWRLPFPEDATLLELPIPRLGGVRQGGHAHVARAAFELTGGRADQAERNIREALSVGFLLADHGNTLLENLIGYVMLDYAGKALALFYEGAGRRADTETLASSWNAARTAAERALGGAVSPEPVAALADMPRVVTDPDEIRGLRWEYFMNLSTLGPCISMHRVVFGPGEVYAQWLEQARASLVRFDSEAALFDLGRHGWFGKPGAGGGGLVSGIFGLSMGGGEAAGSCRSLVSALPF